MGKSPFEFGICVKIKDTDLFTIIKKKSCDHGDHEKLKTFCKTCGIRVYTKTIRIIADPPPKWLKIEKKECEGGYDDIDISENLKIVNGDDIYLFDADFEYDDRIYIIMESVQEYKEKEIDFAKLDRFKKFIDKNFNGKKILMATTSTGW